jgi:hypothetical protein
VKSIFADGRIVLPSSATPAVGVAMSSPIGFREFNEDEYGKFIRTLSDEELVKAGKRLRILCGDVVTPTRGTFDRQLKICREEYRRRHPKHGACRMLGCLQHSVIESGR